MAEEAERNKMVRDQLREREVRDPRVLDVMGRVPRHLFVPEPLQDQAYEDRPQSIGNRQTISQPFMVALMTELLGLSGVEKVLEIGTGSGYQTAVLAELSAKVVSVERHAALAERARDLLEWLGYRNVAVHHGDGTLGWPAEAPYDRILVAAAAPQVPEPLVAQLVPGGTLVIPVGREDVQILQVVTRHPDGRVTTAEHGDCVFVPLIGDQGWHEPPGS